MFRRLLVGLVALSGAAVAGVCVGNPAIASADEQAFISQIYLTAHPSVKVQSLLEFGHLACSVRHSGKSSDEAKIVIWESLDAQGVVSSMAEMGSLVHVAVDTLCPEVGYP
ncbi:DUF732 domain-containing protein [Mycolicibacterium neoaurum]|uniref:DUF732 domain-containing protein n=1 Tax=Mycolicibacterium neoaurum TaxID=1795 RepID=A0AAV2WG52_MYCNE|nr:DUF732 domain-containing protein [Mycolicibacterium neoaurum]TLH50346.1 DUF732 domain-containing protein [Mycolicibacterium neoaurum]CDQ43181.1 hypothetical protein BN1047_01044 [Mycolicibacterium neoaurum]